MKREQRAPWVALTERYILCNFCRYADWQEDGFCCTHPVEAVADRRDINGMEPGDDCWGFRPESGDTVAAASIRLVGWQAEDAAREGEL